MMTNELKGIMDIIYFCRLTVEQLEAAIERDQIFIAPDLINIAVENLIELREMILDYTGDFK